MSQDRSNVFYSPEGNPEIWDEKPEGYFTEAEWIEANPPEEPEEPSPPTEEELKVMYSNAIQNYLDEFAQERLYDSIQTAVTYADPEGTDIFSIEGNYCKKMRSEVWGVGYAIQDDVLAGNRPIPTTEQLLEELPKLIWPTERPGSMEG